MMRSCVVILFCAVLLLGCRAETDVRSGEVSPVRTAALQVDKPGPDSVTAQRFEEIMQLARDEAWYRRPFGEIVQDVGAQLIGTPYVAGKLDAPPEETLITDLTGFDCVLFVESVLAMARGIALQDYTYETYVAHIRDQRYRDGVMNGYCSRLHYFSEWIADNEERGTVRNVTRELGGVRLDKQLTFMSEHRESYPRFATNDSLYRGILSIEEDLRSLEIYYIPQEDIRDAYDRLQPGDIIATATDIPGLDVTHSGLVYVEEDGGRGFLHASSASGAVKVSPDLQLYVQNNKKQIGIVVARPVDPRE